MGHRADEFELTCGGKRIDPRGGGLRPGADARVAAGEGGAKVGLVGVVLEVEEGDADVLDRVAPETVVEVEDGETGAGELDVAEVEIGVEEAEAGRIGVEIGEGRLRCGRRFPAGSRGARG